MATTIIRNGDFKALIAQSFAVINGKKKKTGYSVYFQKYSRNFDNYTLYGIKNKEEATKKAKEILKKIVAKYS
jgi:hypothetical protein